MKRIILILGLSITIQSCIPLRIAPNIKDYKITKGKKFKRSLPQRQMFLFEDPKKVNEFYNYVNTKFKLDHSNVYDDIPFSIKEKQYFFSFYEVDIPNKTLNLVPLAIDAILLNVDQATMMDALYETRKGNWYIAIEVYSNSENDCLEPTSPSLIAVSEYLKLLKNEYLASSNYNEVLLKD
jgi:hypothetical protein